MLTEAAIGPSNCGERRMTTEQPATYDPSLPATPNTTTTPALDVDPRPSTMGTILGTVHGIVSVAFAGSPEQNLISNFLILPPAATSTS